MRKSSSYILLCALCSINVFATVDTERQSLIINPGDQFNTHTQLTEKKGCFSCFGKRKQQPVQYHIQNNVLINMVHHKPQTEVVSYTGIVHEPIKSKFVVLNTMMPQSPSQPSQKDDEKQKKAELETIIHQDKSDQNSKPFIRRAHSTFNKSVQQDKTDKNQKSSIKRSNSTFIQPVQVSEDLQTELKEQDLLHLSAIQQVETFTLCPTDFEAKEITQLKEGISNLELKLQSFIAQQNNQSQSQMTNDGQVNHQLQTQITTLLSNFQQMQQDISSIKAREQDAIIKSLQQQLTQIEAEQAEVNQSFQQQLTQVGEQISEVKDDVKKVDERVDTVELTIQQMQLDIQKQYQTTVNQITELQQTILDDTKNYEEIDGVKEFQQQMQLVLQDAQNQLNEVAALKIQQLEQQKQVTTVEPQLITQQVEDPKVTELELKINELTEKFGETVTRLEEKIGSGTNTQGKVDELITKIKQDTETKISNINKAAIQLIGDNTATTNRTTKQLNELTDKVDDINVMLYKLKSQLDQYKK